MDMSNYMERSTALVEALPYIQAYYGKTVVVKYGGNAMNDEAVTTTILQDIAALKIVGVNPILVHGGGPEISQTIEKFGNESVFIDGLRYTDAETAEIVRMVLAGKVNKSLVELLERGGGKAVGLCGHDGHLLKCEKQDDKLGFVGKIVGTDTTIITDLLGLGYIPVVSTIGYDDEGNVYNINADTAAAALSGALNAEGLILMSDIKGLLENKDDPDSLIKKVYVSDIPAYVKQGIISGGMIPKIECCKEAIRRGVKKVFITDGRVPHSILIEILSEEGSGTMFL